MKWGTYSSTRLHTYTRTYIHTHMHAHTHTHTHTHTRTHAHAHTHIHTHANHRDKVCHCVIVCVQLYSACVCVVAWLCGYRCNSWISRWSLNRLAITHVHIPMRQGTCTNASCLTYQLLFIVLEYVLECLCVHLCNCQSSRQEQGYATVCDCVYLIV